MSKNHYHGARFSHSAAKLQQLPADQGIEVAFAGRSNAGKSSALNTICQQKQLARTSKTPGRTQLINLFDLTDNKRLVDLPGYGYAKVAINIKKRWQQTLARYLETRQCLVGLILLMDCRHPLMSLDENMIMWCYERQLPIHILLTKADKLTQSARAKALRTLKSDLSEYEDCLTIQLFSSVKAIGHKDVYQKLDEWFELSQH